MENGLLFSMDVSTIYEVPILMQKEGLDKIVQACLACHYQSCPGPLVRIEKHIFDAGY